MKYRFAQMTMHEVKDAARQDRVAVLPVATYEDHGAHLPVDTDVVLATRICDRAVSRIPQEAILVPAVPHGYSPHHMDYPGTLTIGWDTFIRYVRDVCCSLAHQGFERILIINGHGSNASPLDMAARLANVEYESGILCAFASHWDLRRVKEVSRTLRDSDFNGAAHAGEYETSLYLALEPDLVDMSKAVDERTPLSPSFSIDLLEGTHPQGVGRPPHAPLEQPHGQRRDGGRDEGDEGKRGAVPGSGRRGPDRAHPGVEGHPDPRPPRRARRDAAAIDRLDLSATGPAPPAPRTAAR